MKVIFKFCLAGLFLFECQSSPFSCFSQETVSAPEETGSIWIGPDGEPLPFRSDEEATAFLCTARIVSTERMEEGINKPLQVLLEKDGVRAFAVFRDVRVLQLNPRGFDFRDDFIFETAAYELSKLLGLPYISPP